MIKDSTVFILGAGASVPYGYPTGAELRERIVNNAFGTKILHVSLGKSAHLPFNVIGCDTKDNLIEVGRNFSNKFFDSGRSIDVFLENNQSYSDTGKLAIVCNILESESASNFNEKMKPEYRNQDWYSYLLNRMISGLTGKNGYEIFGENKVSFITFNYDRSLEHFLYTRLSNSFFEATQEVANLKRLTDELMKIPIYHVYGSIRDLFWQSEKGIPYGHAFDFAKLWEIKDNIRLINQRVKSDEIEEMKKIISDSKRVFFLGFGYAPENMNILDLYKIITPGHQVYGTAMGLSDTEVLDIQHQFIKNNPAYKNMTNGTLKSAINLQKKNCYELLKDYLIKI